MTLQQLIELADKGYQQRCGAISRLMDCFDPQTGESTDDLGDTLALYIVGEIVGCFEPDVPEGEQKETVIGAMRAAVEDLENVISALEA